MRLYVCLYLFYEKCSNFFFGLNAQMCLDSTILSSPFSASTVIKQTALQELFIMPLLPHTHQKVFISLSYFPPPPLPLHLVHLCIFNQLR